MILVIDSSVWISALEFGGTPLRVLDLVTGRGRIAICKSILEEVRSALIGKFHWPEGNVLKAFAAYERETIVVEITNILRGVCRDRKDDVIVECAVLGGANLIVTGDNDLLAVRNYREIRIITPREFVDEFEK